MARIYNYILSTLGVWLLQKGYALISYWSRVKKLEAENAELKAKLKAAESKEQIDGVAQDLVNKF